MKKVLLFFCLISSLPLVAGGLKLMNNNQVVCSQFVSHPVISDDGTKLLFTKSDYQGLKMLNLSDGTVTNISEDATAGFNPMFTYDESVYFNGAAMVGNLRNYNLKKWDYNDNTIVDILPLSREDRVIDTHNGKLRVFSKSKSVGLNNSTPIIRANDNEIEVTINGVTRAIKPINNGQCYLWLSLSPDGNKMLFVEPFRGVYMCNIDGSNVTYLGRGDNPKWINNDYILVTKSKDDGDIILSSRLYSVNVKTKAAIAISNENELVEDATVAHAVNKIAYSTTDGMLYIVNFEIEK